MEGLDSELLLAFAYGNLTLSGFFIFVIVFCEFLLPVKPYKFMQLEPVLAWFCLSLTRFLNVLTGSLVTLLNLWLEWLEKFFNS